MRPISWILTAQPSQGFPLQLPEGIGRGHLGQVVHLWALQMACASMFVRREPCLSGLPMTCLRLPMTWDRNLASQV